MLLEVVDGGEGTVVWHKEGERKDQEEEEVSARCSQCQEEGRGGQGWLATPNGCRLLAQVKKNL